MVAQTIQLLENPTKEHKDYNTVSKWLEIKAVSSLQSRMNECSTTFKYLLCNACTYTWKVVSFCCFILYCWKCKDTRFERNYSRIMRKDIRSRRMFHLVIGFAPTKTFNKELFKEQRKVMSRFYKRVRKLGFKISGFRVRDVSYKEKDGDGSYYWHYHHLLLPDSRFNNCARLFNNEMIIASSGKVRVVKLFGYKNKKGAFAYISKRQAGIFGDAPNRYGYKDIMTYRNFEENIIKTRSLVQLGFPNGLGSKPSPNDSVKCPKCGSKDVSYITLERFNTIPPPDQLNINKVMFKICPERQFEIETIIEDFYYNEKGLRESYLKFSNKKIWV